MDIKRYQVVKLDGQLPVTKDAMHVILTPHEFHELYGLLQHEKYTGNYLVGKTALTRLDFKMSQWLASGEVPE